MAHWLTQTLANELIEAAHKAKHLVPSRAAGGKPDAGPLKSIQLQACDCVRHSGFENLKTDENGLTTVTAKKPWCENLILIIDGRDTDFPVTTAEDLILAVLFAESLAEGR